MPVETNAELEFSRPLALDDIKPSGTVVKLTATDDEQERLARRFDLPDVARMVAEFRVTRGASGIPIRVIGRVVARVTQRCVVSLEAFSSDVSDDIEVEFVPGDDAATAEDFAADDVEAEFLSGDQIDLGELAAQHLALALDPYPRKPGAEPPEWTKGRENKEESKADNPFSVLSELRKKNP